MCDWQLHALNFTVCDKPSGTKPPEKVIGVSPPAVWYLKDDWRPCMCGNWVDRSLLAASMCLSVSMPLGLSRTALSLIVRFNSATHGCSEACVWKVTCCTSQREYFFGNLTRITNTTCIHVSKPTFALFLGGSGFPDPPVLFLGFLLLLTEGLVLSVVSCIQKRRTIHVNTPIWTNTCVHVYIHTYLLWLQSTPIWV